MRAGPVLGIESSCDETAAAVLDADGRVLAEALLSQSGHAAYGGVVPEIAARAHLAALPALVERVMREAGVGFTDLAGVAATSGPGLLGGLIVGSQFAKGIAIAHGLPYVAVNHLEAHALTARLPGLAPDGAAFPYLLLLVSGGHCQCVAVEGVGQHTRLGTTLDDAAGEAFDKVARLLGLGYPGGPAIQQAAAERDTTRANPYTLPRAWLPGTWDFSFSGLKTATGNLLAKARANGDEIAIADVADAFQDAVVDALATKAVRAAEERNVREVLLAGGVAANLALRERLTADLGARGITLRYPPVAYCTDNAAMIGAAAYFHLRRGERDGYDLEVRPNLQLPFAAPHGSSVVDR